MKSMALTALSQMGMITQPDPVLKEPGDVLVKITHVGVCGSDMHYYSTGHIGTNRVEYPFVLGHEGAGVVAATGSSVKKIRSGQRIAIEPAIPCLQCDQCLAGRTHTCRNLKFLGNPGQSPGLLSEFIVLPEHSCHPLPDHVENETAVLAEPLSIAVWAGDLAGIRQDSSIGILGSGPIGMSALKYCLCLGADRIYVTDRLDYRVEAAREAGARWAGNPDKEDIVAEILAQENGGLDTVFDCCGMQEAMNQAIELLKPGGKIMIVGIPEFELWQLPADIIRRKEIGFQNVRRQNDRLQKAIDLIAGGLVKPSPLITHRFPLPDAGKAFDLVAGYGDRVMKAIVQI